MYCLMSALCACACGLLSVRRRSASSFAARAVRAPARPNAYHPAHTCTRMCSTRVHASYLRSISPSLPPSLPLSILSLSLFSLYSLSLFSLLLLLLSLSLWLVNTPAGTGRETQVARETDSNRQQPVYKGEVNRFGNVACRHHHHVWPLLLCVCVCVCVRACVCVCA